MCLGGYAYYVLGICIKTSTVHKLSLLMLQYLIIKLYLYQTITVTLSMGVAVFVRALKVVRLGG